MASNEISLDSSSGSEISEIEDYDEKMQEWACLVGKTEMLWSGLYPSKKHLARLLCSAIIHDHLAAARGAFHMHSADPVELRPS